MSIANKMTENKRRVFGWIPMIFAGKSTKSEVERDIFAEFDASYSQFLAKFWQISNRWDIILRWESVLANKETGENALSIAASGKRIGLTERYNKKWIALRLGLSAYNLLVKDNDKFASEINPRINQISQLDSQLAEEMRSLGFSQRGKTDLGTVLQPMAKLLENPRLVIAYVKTHYDELMKQVDRIHDKATADILRMAIVSFSDREVEELNRCTNDIRSWPYIMSYGIQLFIERGFLFINGGRSRYDRNSFLGFSMYFKDENLVSEMKKTPEIKRLLTYMQEIQFFTMARDAIKRSVETQGNWEGFYEFYNNLKKGKNYIRMVRERFGNEQFARVLEAFEQKKHEAPVDWENELENLDQQLTRRAYEIVVQPAAQTIIKIFEQRIKQLEQQKITALADLKKLMLEGDSSTKAKELFLRILNRKKKQLIKKLENERMEFQNLTENVVLTIPDLVAKLNLLDEVTQDLKERRAGAEIAKRLGDWQGFIAKTSGAAKTDGSILDNSSTAAITRSGFGSYVSLELAERGVKVKKRIEAKYIAGLRILHELSYICEVIMPETTRCLAQIESKKKDYIDQIGVFLTQKPNQFASLGNGQPNKDDGKTSSQIISLQPKRLGMNNNLIDRAA